MGVLALGVFLARNPPARWRWPTVWWACGLSAALALTWMGRGVILSGCPFYPSRALSLPVEWRISTDVWPGLDPLLRNGGEMVRVDMLQRATSTPAFARMPGWITRPVVAALNNPSHTVQWLTALTVASAIEIALPALLAIIAIVAIVVRSLVRGQSLAVRPVEWLILVPGITGVTVWVIVSPEPRYIASTIWIVSAALVAMMLREMKHPARFVIVVLAMAALPILYRMLILDLNPASGPVRSALFIPAGPDHGFHPIPTVELVPAKARLGLIVWVAKVPGPTWDAPLPSTASVNTHLMQRTPGDLGDGFVIDHTFGP
jgi:hypothetical protein